MGEHSDNMLAPIVIGAIATVILLIAVLVLAGFTLRRRALEHKPPSPGERLLEGKLNVQGRTSTRYEGNQAKRDSTRSPYRGYREVATISSDVFDKNYPDVQIQTAATPHRSSRKGSQHKEEIGGRRGSLKAYQTSGGGRSPFQWGGVDQITPEEAIACLPLQQEHREPVGGSVNVFSSHNQAFLTNNSNSFSGGSPTYPTDPLVLSKESRI